MSNLEFEDDDQLSPTEPSKKKSTASSSPDGASFDPFANTNVSVNQDAASLGSTNAGSGVSPDQPGKAPSKTPSRPSSGLSKPQPQPTEEEDDDAPVDRRDLWQCPHCGAKNKPKRTTCRECGKSPEEPVAAPWYLQPRQLGIIGLVILTLWLLVSAMFHVDMSHKTPGIGTLDRSPRMVSTEEVVDLATGSLQVEATMSVSGRVLSAKGPIANGDVQVWEVMVLTGDASVVGDPQQFQQYRSDISAKEVEVRLNQLPAPLDVVDFVLLRIIDTNNALTDCSEEPI